MPSQPMHLIYLSDAAIPSRSTNGMQTMHMCAAFAAQGIQVTLAYPARRREPPEGFAGDVRGFYGVPATFTLRPLGGMPAGLLEGSGLVSRALRALRFGAYLLRRSRPGTPSFVCYCRSMLAASVAQTVRRLWGGRSSCRVVALEVHDVPRTAGAWRLLHQADAVVAISEALRAALLERGGLGPDRIWVEHDGVAVDAVRPGGLDRDAARRDLDLEEVSGPVVCYTGRAIAGKGVDVLLAAAHRLAAIDAQLVIVGKVYEDSYRETAPANVRFTGFLPPSQVPPYLGATDIVVLPTTADLPYASYTSPLKLFEYMASGRPIVASDLPVLREVLRHEENALLFPPGDSAALASAVERLWADPGLGARLAEIAEEDAVQFDWTARAERILTRLTASVA
jgi:glycosyltransferase involved in cell wall biosynthesis